MYQKCPVCDGTGLVSTPPWVAGDQPVWVDTNAAPYPCKACNGTCLLWVDQEEKEVSAE